MSYWPSLSSALDGVLIPLHQSEPKDVFEDITTLGGVSQHPMIQAVVGIISFTDFLRTSSFGKLQSVALVK